MLSVRDRQWKAGVAAQALRPRAADPRKRRTPRPRVVDRMQGDLAGLAAGAGVGDGFADAEVLAHGAVAVARSEVDPDVVGSDADQANGGFRVDLPGAGLADDEVRAALHAGGVAHGLAQGVVLALGQGEFLDQAHVGVLQRFGGGGDLLQRGVAVAVEGAAEFGEAGLECFEVLLLLVLHLDEELVGIAELLHDPADGLVAEHAEHEDRDGQAGALERVLLDRITPSVDATELAGQPAGPGFGGRLVGAVMALLFRPHLRSPRGWRPQPQSTARSLWLSSSMRSVSRGALPASWCMRPTALSKAPATATSRVAKTWASEW